MFFESWWLNISILLGLVLALTFDYVTKFFSYWYIRHVPYKTSVPFYGSDYHRVLGLRSNTAEVNTLYNQYPKEDFVGSVKSRIPDLIVRNPDLIKEVLSTEFESFKSRGLDLDKSQDICLRNNLFYAEGEKWTLLREKLEILLNDVTVSEDCFLGCLSGTNGNINVQQLLTKVLDDVFKNLFLPDSSEAIITDLRTTFCKRTLKDKLFSYLKNIFPSVYNLFGLSTMSKPSKKSLDVIQQSNFSNKINSVFDLSDKSVLRKLKSKPDEVTFGVLSSLVSEGYVPCLNVLTALLFELAKNPETQNQSRNSTEYLNSVVKETLRLYAPLSVITRQCVKTYKFSQSKVLIDKRITVNIPVDALHKDESYYKEAGQFKPERFVNGLAPSYAFLPYGTGPRQCIGEQLSQEIIRKVAKAIITRFQVEPLQNTPKALPMVDFNFSRVIGTDVWLRFKSI